MATPNPPGHGVILRAVCHPPTHPPTQPASLPSSPVPLFNPFRPPRPLPLLTWPLAARRRSAGVSLAHSPPASPSCSWPSIIPTLPRGCQVRPAPPGVPRVPAWRRRPEPCCAPVPVWQAEGFARVKSPWPSTLPETRPRCHILRPAAPPPVHPTPHAFTSLPTLPAPPQQPKRSPSPDSSYPSLAPNPYPAAFSLF